MRRLAAMTLGLALLAGCASQSPAPESPREKGDWADQKPRLEALDS